MSAGYGKIWQKHLWAGSMTGSTRIQVKVTVGRHGNQVYEAAACSVDCVKMCSAYPHQCCKARKAIRFSFIRFC